MTAIPPARLAAAFKDACLAELEALKPGNVHVFADGHGMVVQDFVKSAEAAAAVIAQPGLTLGQRVACAVDASWDAVGCNTNLGIILLCAPLLHAALTGIKPTLQACVRDVLAALTVADAERVFRAIVQASPAGLGASELHDVREPPGVTLLQAMRHAQHQDRIAFQYASDFADLFEFGARRYRETGQRWGWQAWATTSVYLGWLARDPDTHVLRKYGMEIAQQLQVQAGVHDQALLAHENPKQYQRSLLQWDTTLKARGINPGTSADLTVASLLVVALEKMMTDDAQS